MMAAVCCLGILAAVSVLVLYLDANMPAESDVLQEQVISEEAENLISEIDSIPIAGAKLARLAKLQASLEELPDKIKAQVTKKREEKLAEALEWTKALNTSNKNPVVKDKSPSQYEMEFPVSGNAMLQRYEGKIAFEGRADVKGEGADETFSRLFSEDHSFTIEAFVNPRDTGSYDVIKPYDPSNYNMIVSKGDSCMGFRISESSIQFFIRNEEQVWPNAEIKLSEKQLNSWIHVAGVYDGDSVSVYLEGSGMHTISNAGAIVRSEYPFCIGYCPETGRSSTCSISSVRVYPRALTEEELEGEKCTPKDAVLWYDFDDYRYSEADLSPKGIRSYTSAIQIDEEQNENIIAEPIPFYAKVNIIYETDNRETIEVSKEGTVTGVSRGTAKVTAAIENTNFTTVVPVQVGKKFALKNLLDWIVQRLFLLDALIFVIVLLALVYKQREQMISCTTELSEAVRRIGTEQSVDLDFVPGEVKLMLHEAEERFKKKDFKAKQAEQRKSDLIVYLAHDLKTPIASIVGYLMLLKDMKQLPEDMHQQYVEIALGSAQRLNELIDEFFEISRFNLSYIEMEYREINLTWFLEQLISEIEPLFTEKGLSCKIEVPRNVHLYCDPDKLERVFSNLLRNAIHYSYPKTEIYIRVEAGENMKFICENCGDTIEEDKLERIFEQFYRLDSSRSADTGGAGLGLAIAKIIVELHKGTIEVQSKENRIKFTIVIPWHV